MSRDSERATTASAGDDWSMDLEAGERGPLRQHVLFLYGTGLAIGLHLALIHLYLWRSVGAFFFFLVATLAFSTLTLVLWQSVLPRLPRRSSPVRVALQLIISVTTFAILSFLATEVHPFLFGGPSLPPPD